MHRFRLLLAFLLIPICVSAQTITPRIRLVSATTCTGAGTPNAACLNALQRLIIWEVFNPQTGAVLSSGTENHLASMMSPSNERAMLKARLEGYLNANSISEPEGIGSLPSGSGGSEAESIVKLTADVSNSTVTLADVTGLSFTAAASTDYIIEIWVIYTTAATTTGINLSVNGPASPTSVSFLRFTGGEKVSNFNTFDAGSANASALAGVNFCQINVLLRNGATAGTFILRFASEVAASAVTIKAGSAMRFRVI